MLGGTGLSCTLLTVGGGEEVKVLCEQTIFVFRSCCGIDCKFRKKMSQWERRIPTFQDVNSFALAIF